MLQRKTIDQAPKVLNSNDKAMWLIGWNEAVDALAKSYQDPQSDTAITHQMILDECFQCKKLSVAAFTHAVRWAESIHRI